MLARALIAATSAVALLTGLVAAPAPASATTAGTATSTASALPELLAVAEPDAAHPYSRAAFEHWTDADRDGCNTRYEVLIQESTTPTTVRQPCALSGGTWVSPYDGFATTDPSKIEIDHVVALAEAWRSGAWGWTSAQREAFANDLDVPYALTAASSTSNQAKADKDPARWLPTNSRYTCEYVTSWALVKYRWSLTVDTAELSALRSTLRGDCGATPITLPTIMRPRTGSPEPPQPAGPSFAPGVTRLGGSDRYDTAVRVSQRYAPGVGSVFVATGGNFPDALAAAAGAARLGGPLLLTPTNSLPANVANEVRRLRPGTIYIAGAGGAVSTRVETALRSIAPVKRLGGSTRYETANRIVEHVFPSSSRAFIATGRTFPDALAATGAAGAQTAPVILVDGAQGRLAPETLRLLQRLQVKSVTIAGGSGAVSSGIERDLSARFETKRIGGSSRYETAAGINNAYFARGTAPAAFLATGQNFPDALAGAALAGRIKSPVYVTTAACVPEAAHASLRTLGAPSTVVLGSTAVVSDNAAKNIGCLAVGRPTLSGTARVGATVTVRPGTWTAGTTLRYQWLADGVAIRGATSASLRVSEAHIGKQLSARVTGSKSGYLTATATSPRTAKVAYPGSTTPLPGTWDCPRWAPIKGNQESMIYHVPGGQFYARTNPEVCFRTEADARAAGYRRSLR